MINEATRQQAANSSGVAPVQFSAPAEPGDFDVAASAVALDAAKRSPFNSDSATSSGE